MSLCAPLVLRPLDTSRPITGNRFSYHGQIVWTTAGAYVFQVEVPAGMAAVVNCIGGLIDAGGLFGGITYSLRVDSVDDPLCAKVGERDNSGGEDQSLWFRTPTWLASSLFVKGGRLEDPVVVRAGASFGLWAVKAAGLGSFGMGGMISGYWTTMQFINEQEEYYAR